MAEGVVIGAAVSVVIELIKALIPITTTAVRCGDECRRLKEKLESIQPGVEEIGHQLSELRTHDPNSRLVSVADWLEELKKELDLASITVHKCNTASRLGRYLCICTNEKLTKKMTAHYDEISRLAGHRATLNLQLTGLMKMAEQSKPSEPLTVWRQYVAQVSDIKRREDFTRLSQREREMSNSTHYGYPGSSSAQAPQHHWGLHW